MSEAPVAVLASPIASPMSSDKLKKKLYGLCEKAASDKLLRRGVKDVVKALRKGEKGLCILAGDVSPIDVISHVPFLCEEVDVAYIYVTSRAELGAASGTKRPTSVVLVKPHADGDEAFDECVKKVASSKPVF